MHRLALLTRLGDYFERRRQLRAYRETIRTVEALPFHIRKDIGWPAAYEAPRNGLI